VVAVDVFAFERQIRRGRNPPSPILIKLPDQDTAIPWFDQTSLYLQVRQRALSQTQLTAFVFDFLMLTRLPGW
jgi:hypothetical protein